MAPEKEKILEKIRKLLELSKSSNEHEAAAAAGAAARLMAEYELAEADLTSPDERPDDVVEESLGIDKKTVMWRATLADGISESVGGDCVIGAVGSSRGGYVRSYQVIVPARALSTVKYLYAYLTNEVDRLAEVAYRAHGAGESARGWKSAFRQGAADMISERLKATRKEVHREARQANRTTALAVIDKQTDAIAAHIKQRYPRMQKTRSYAGSSSWSGYAAGQSAGRSVPLGGDGGKLGRGTPQLKG